MSTESSAKGRTILVLPPEEQSRLDALAVLAAAEQPQLAERFRRVDAAAQESTLSGALRNAIHSGPWDLLQLEQRTGIVATNLADFLEGAPCLTLSDAELLVDVLGLELVKSLRSAATTRPPTIKSTASGRDA
jgi:hypothetical protein